MKQCILYTHGGSGNHGCEAIVRASTKIINRSDITLFSKRIDEDIKFGIDKLVNLKNDEYKPKKYSLEHILSVVRFKVFKDSLAYKKLLNKNILQNAGKNTVAISIGGDSYCYEGMPEQLSAINTLLNEKGVKTVLWECSLEPDLLKNVEFCTDMKKYSLITARETTTYEALKKIGAKVKFFPDPAFQLGKTELPLPIGFKENNTIGINISPLIIRNEDKNGLTFSNYLKLIQYILDSTDMSIALIPHVMWKHDNDIEPLTKLYEHFNDSKRVILIQEHNCLELKGFISRCRMFIGARTHTTIAAYSTCVPTLVVGYSIKAKGIAKDIFGTYDNYVIPVQTLKNEDELIKAFEWLKFNENSIRKHLFNFIPGYCAKALEAGNEINNLMDDEVKE